MTQHDPITAAMAYRQALAAVANAPDLATARQHAQRGLAIEFTRPSYEQVVINSGVAGRTQEPYVTFGMTAPVAQISTAQARELAHHILAAADAAESDAFLLTWIDGRSEPPLDGRQRAAILTDFRAFREKRRGEGA